MLDAASASDDDTKAYVTRLEALADESRLPEGDELIADIERFLREGERGMRAATRAAAASTDRQPGAADQASCASSVSTRLLCARPHAIVSIGAAPGRRRAWREAHRPGGR